MASDKRIYVVTEDHDEGERKTLVRAATPAQAIRHEVKDRFTAEVATTDEVAELVGGGTKVQDASVEA